MRQLEVNGCTLMPFSPMGDHRGTLIAIETGRDVPFNIARVYYVFNTKNGVARGFHAHRALRQILIAVSGSCVISVEDGAHRNDVILDDPELGLSIEGLVWREMHDFSPDCVLLVLADCAYDEADYIRNYDDFLAAVSGRSA